MRSRAPDHKKMDYRQISNPWRRFGSLKTIYAMGGHVIDLTTNVSNQIYF